MQFREQIQSFKPSDKQEESDKNIILNYIDIFSNNILTRDNKIAHLTSSGFVVNYSFDKVLMIYHKIYDTWTWTGGHADGESNLLYTSIKEAIEETGLEKVKTVTKEIASLDILPVWGHLKNSEYVSAHLHLNASFILLADENESLKINTKETNGVMWIDINDIEKYSKEPEVIKVYYKLIKKMKAINK